MIPGLFDTLVDFDRDVFRNIATIRESQELLDDLSPDPRQRAYGEAVVQQRQEELEFRFPVISRPFEYGIALSDGLLGRPVTRLSDGSRFGVWYGSFEPETTVHETVYHWGKRLQAMRMTFEQEVVAERRVFQVRLAGLLVDLSAKHNDFPGLIDPDSYSFTHRVGNYLHDQAQNGLLVKAARCEGTNAAAFIQRVLSNPRHHCYLTYRWKPGSRRVSVERTPGRAWMQIGA